MRLQRHWLRHESWIGFISAYCTIGLVVVGFAIGLSILLIVFAQGCSDDKPADSTSSAEISKDTTRKLSELSVFWARHNSDILVKIRGFRLRWFPKEVSGVKFRTSAGDLIIESPNQQRHIRIVDSGELSVIAMDMVQWDSSEVCVILRMSHIK